MGPFHGVAPAVPALSGPRLDLRAWHPDDADRVREALSDPGMREFLVLAEPFDADAARRWVERRCTPDAIRLDRAMVERSSGRVVGSAALQFPDDPTVGYWVARDSRGHGYAAEAVRLLADRAFGLDVPRVRLSCDVRNLASVRTALSAGFAAEGVSREQFLGGGHDGLPARYADAARFARLADDPGDPIAPAFPALPGGQLSDGVLALRPATADDARGYLEDDDPVAMAWSFDARPRTAVDAARRMAGAGLDWLVGRTACLTLVDVASGGFAGDLQVRLAGPPHVAELGYVVHPRFRGRGYTTRALRLIVAWAFDVAGYARLELGAKTGNVASQRAALSAGFTPDGVRKRRLRNPDGTFADEATFVLVNPRVVPPGGVLSPA